MVAKDTASRPLLQTLIAIKIDINRCFFYFSAALCFWLFVWLISPVLLPPLLVSPFWWDFAKSWYWIRWGNVITWNGRKEADSPFLHRQKQPGDPLFAFSSRLSLCSRQPCSVLQAFHLFQMLLWLLPESATNYTHFSLDSIHSQAKEVCVLPQTFTGISFFKATELQLLDTEERGRIGIIQASLGGKLGRPILGRADKLVNKVVQ